MVILIPVLDQTHQFCFLSLDPTQLLSLVQTLLLSLVPTQLLSLDQTQLLSLVQIQFPSLDQTQLMRSYKSMGYDITPSLLLCYHHHIKVEFVKVSE